MSIDEFVRNEFDAHAGCDGYGQLSVSYNQTEFYHLINSLAKHLAENGESYTKVETVQIVPISYSKEEILGVTVLAKYAPIDSFFRNAKWGQKVVVQISKIE